ncbi:MAG: hypothetical protein VX416_11435 [Pseudomonadota bacterium]|nr:hypothetical protein [Pseudomonadota bacterium]
MRRGARAWGRGARRVDRGPAAGGSQKETSKTDNGYFHAERGARFGWANSRNAERGSVRINTGSVATDQGTRSAVRLARRTGGGAGHVSLFKKT